VADELPKMSHVGRAAGPIITAVCVAMVLSGGVDRVLLIRNYATTEARIERARSDLVHLTKRVADMKERVTRSRLTLNTVRRDLGAVRARLALLMQWTRSDLEKELQKQNIEKGKGKRR